ncbi:cytosine permease [Microbacterium sp. W4I4]|uniref:purine-cytosine permease family protein n=1 Tax=Microbacterium sp. W4I4 TaxID=3042295 RepID=UPI00277E2BD1|nr:cytosine permease [Microbacterium sp. W4I4]MDQ0613268.1 cytosine permease [Microbacterium sp. W4I4]
MTTTTVAETTAASEFEHEPVPLSHRKSLFSVSAVWFGFPMIITNAIPGGMMVASLGFWRGVAAILVANVLMMVYVSLLSWRAGRTGKSFALQAIETFGTAGYIIASGFLSTVVIGWFAFNTGNTGATLHLAFGWNETLMAALAGLVFIGVTYLGIRALSVLGAIAAPLFVVAVVIAIVIASTKYDFAAIWSFQGSTDPAVTAISFGAAVTAIMATFLDSGTMTADFTRWSKNGREAVLATLTAFPIASVVSQVSGGIFVAAGALIVDGNFSTILTSTGSPWLNVFLLIFVAINLGSVATHCLYNGALGWSHIAKSTMRVFTLVLGVIGVIAAMLGVWYYFAPWLALLGVIVPPMGAVLIVDQIFMARRNEGRAERRFRSSAFIAWAIGAAFALLSHNLAPEFSDAVVGLVVGGLAYWAIENLSRKKELTR